MYCVQVCGDCILRALFDRLPSYRETRLKTMLTWTREALEASGRESWGSVFRLTSASHDELFSVPLFSDRVWFEPGAGKPVGLFL